MKSFICISLMCITLTASAQMRKKAVAKKPVTGTSKGVKKPVEENNSSPSVISIELRTVLVEDPRTAYDVYAVYNDGSRTKVGTANSDKSYSNVWSEYVYLIQTPCNSASWIYIPSKGYVDAPSNRYTCSSSAEAIRAIVEKCYGL